MRSHDMTRSPFQAVVSGLFDESILVREARRWRHQRRWGLLAMAVLIGGAIAGLLIGQVLFDWSHPGENLDLPRDLFALLMAALTLLGSLLAFYQSMQSLRREVHTQTLEGLFLTLQTDRGVMLSVVAAGVIAGGVLQLAFLPFVLFAAIALSVNALQMIAALALMFASLVLAAAIGAFWFFVSQQSFEVNHGFRRTALNLIVPGAFGGAAAYFTHFWWTPDRLALGVVWVCIFYCLAGIIVWSLRSILTEARCLATSPGDASPWKPVSQARAMTFAAAALLGVILLALCYIVPHASDAELSFTMPVSNLAYLFAPTAVGDLLFWSHSALPGSLAVLLSFTAGLAAGALLLGMGVTAAGCQLYRRLRTAPETVTGFSSRPLQVVNVGRDDWRGFGNPVLTRELRTRLRSGDAQMFILIATLLSVAALVIPLSSVGGSIAPTAVADLARSGFVAVAIIQLVIAVLIGPGVGSEMIAVEREKKTFEMLQASRLTERQILWGRVIGCWALLLLLASPAFPLLALGAFLHGITAAAVLITIGSIAAFTFFISMTSVSISALARSSVTGKWTAYALCCFLGAIFTAVPLSLTSASGGQTLAIAAGCAAALGLMFIFVVAPLWYLAIARIRSDGFRSRSRRFRLPVPRRMFARLHRRPVLQTLARTGAWALVTIMCVWGILKLAYHRMDAVNDFSSPAAGINSLMTLALADGPAAKTFRSEMAHAYQDLDQQRTAAESEELLVPLEKLQAPVPPDSQNAAPDYRRLMALLKSKPLGMYGEPAPASHPAGAGYPGGMGGRATYPAVASSVPVGPLYIGKPRAGDGALTDMDTIVSYIGTKDSSPAQEAAVREMLRQRQDVMGLIRQATDKPYCVFTRQYSKGWDVLLPEYATMRNVARILRAESYLLAKQGRYQEAVTEQARGFRLAEHAASDPILIADLVGVACDAISVKGMEGILYLSGPNAKVAAMVREATIKNQPRFSLRHAMMGEISTMSAMFEDARNQSGRSSSAGVLQYIYGIGNDYGGISSDANGNSGSVRLFRAALRTPGVSMLLRRLLAATEAQVIRYDLEFMAGSALPYPQQKAKLVELVRGARDPIENVVQMVTPFFGGATEKVVDARAREAAIIGGASVLHYQAIHGRLPATLADAGPVPIDPFTGHAMGYHLDGSRFVVYSRGQSGSFDGGVLLGFNKTQGRNSSASNVVFAPSNSVVAAAVKNYRENEYFVYPALSNGS